MLECADIWIIVVIILNNIVLPNLHPDFDIGPWYAETPDCEVIESIPINDIKDKIESLSKPILNLGISVRTIDEALSKQLNMEQGLYVVEVTEFSSAEKAGLKAGDIIVKADGNRITTFDEFKAVKNGKEEGDEISLEVIRNGESKTINVKLTAS